MEQIPITQDDVQRASQLPQTRQLLELLGADGGAALERAAAQMKNGCIQDALAQLEPMLNTPQSQALLKQLRQQLG